MWRCGSWYPLPEPASVAVSGTWTRSPRWQWQWQLLAPTPRACRGGALLADIMHAKKEAAVEDPTFPSRPPTMMPRLYGRPGLRLCIPLVAPSPHSSPFMLSPCSQPQSLLPRHWPPKLELQASSPSLHQWTRISIWGIQGCGMDHLCRSLSVLHTSCCTSLRGSEDLPPSWLISPPVMGLLRVWETFPLHSSLSGAQVLSWFPSLSLFSFILSCHLEILLALSEVWGLLPTFSKYSVRIVTHRDVFLMYLWEEMSSTSFYSCVSICFMFLGALIECIYVKQCNILFLCGSFHHYSVLFLSFFF